jgi:hypothetical protein
MEVMALLDHDPGSRSRATETHLSSRNVLGMRKVASTDIVEIPKSVVCTTATSAARPEQSRCLREASVVDRRDPTMGLTESRKPQTRARQNGRSTPIDAYLSSATDVTGPLLAADGVLAKDRQTCRQIVRAREMVYGPSVSIWCVDTVEKFRISVLCRS